MLTEDTSPYLLIASITIVSGGVVMFSGALSQLLGFLVKVCLSVVVSIILGVMIFWGLGSFLLLDSEPELFKGWLLVLWFVLPFGVAALFSGW